MLGIATVGRAARVLAAEMMGEDGVEIPAIAQVSWLLPAS